MEEQLGTLADLFRQVLLRLDKCKREEMSEKPVTTTATSEPPTNNKAYVRASKLEHKSVIELYVALLGYDDEY